MNISAAFGSKFMVFRSFNRRLIGLLFLLLALAIQNTVYCSKIADSKPLYGKYKRSFQQRLNQITRSGGISVVAIDPRNGSIIGIANKKMAYKTAYPPGSILKLITAYAGLKAGKVDFNKTVECRNAYRVEGVKLICSLAGGHGKVGLEKAIAQSCNVYFYQLAKAIGEQRMLGAFHDFGLGSKTGAFRDEAAGNVPTRIPDAVSLVRSGIGEVNGLRVTPLQMAVFAGAIANGGTLYKPFEEGIGKASIIKRAKADVKIYNILRKSMRATVLQGTAKKAAVNGLSVCGKTGSPSIENEPKYRHGWFIGFAPYANPEIAVAVFTEYGHGGTDAAPVAGKVFSLWKQLKAEQARE